MIYLYILIGSCLASHASVVYEQLVRNENFVWQTSRCQNCFTTIYWHDLIPIFSYLFLQGNCRYCKQPIPVALFFYELCGGLLGLLLFLIPAPPVSQIAHGLFLFFCAIAALQDQQQQEFDLNLLLAPLVTGLYLLSQSPPNLFDLTFGVVTATILLWFVHQKQLGLGDLLVYLLICLNFDFTTANSTLLFASIIVLLKNFLQRRYLVNTKNICIPFLPAIYQGLIIQLIMDAL